MNNIINFCYDSFAVANCGDLQPPANGGISFSAGTIFGSVAIFTCNTGYDIIGMESRFCLVDELWNGTTPSCQRMLMYLLVVHVP